MNARNANFLTVFSFVFLSGCTTMGTPHVTPGPEQVFSSPQAAIDALVSANRAGDKTALLKILGPVGGGLISSGDPVADKNAREKFLAAYDKEHRFESEGGGRETLIIGDEQWPLPIPLVHVTNGWQFDTESGAQEILDRRIGRNELTVVKICRQYVEAQREYAAARHGAYAQKIISSAKAHDGLYWDVSAGAKESPLGPLIAHAEMHGYSAKVGDGKKPFFGYYYKILTAQGRNASDGAQNFISKGRMTKGFALIAWPAKYEDSGVMTFIVNDDGIVYQKNLGANTNVLAPRIDKFDPDQSWNIAD